ncbi:uncharacterized protein BDZ99DRAFT_405330 [Mytilinidion resinicola]|uniref:2'-phosphotransferase n=1 Tax=Mytilinidion resinicola TaxID=574789 RepID=A0A6A6ZBB0_9PEZI|nr:uncharacterized protein BDZ99DRAFT_405330 [Mytilinidion resinicola]KAF2817595.1 hypothetical protein BDZ99DRAFT_405330 [Mytilinidion resinicola]
MSSRRGGRGGGDRRRELPRDVQVSKKLSWLLRHGAQQEKLTLGDGGYVSVADVLRTQCIKGLKVTFDEIKTIVADNDKQRFSLIPAAAASSGNAGESATETIAEPEGLDSEDPSCFLIRANQGHSIKVDSEGLLTPITAEDAPGIVIHGTTNAAWPLILKTGGLRRMGRNHIHFAPGLPAGLKPVEPVTKDSNEAAQTEAETKPLVISGMRHSSTILIYIDITKALEAGIKFWKSDNGVILTEGDDKGFVGYQFFKSVEVRNGGGEVLMRDGVLPEGVVVDLSAADDEVPGGRGKGKKRGGGGGRGGKGRGKATVVDDSEDVWAGV